MSLFPHFELSRFSGLNTIKVYRYWVPYVCNSSCSFMPIVLKLHRCFCHGLKIRGLDIILRLICVTLSAFWTYIFQAWILSKCINSGCLVWVTSTVLCRSYWNFTGVFVMVWRYACDLDIILRLILSLFPQFEL